MAKELRRPLTEEEKRECEETLQEENGQNFTKSLSVKIKPNYTEKICPELMYILTGHGPFAEHLARIGVSELQSCRFCGAERENVGHFQEGCRGLDLVLPREVDSEDELESLIGKAKALIGKLRSTPI